MSVFFAFSENLVDQPGYGKNTIDLTDFIQITYSVKLINLDQIRERYLNDGLSAAQIARQFGVAESSILARLHQKPGGSTCNL